MQTAARTSALAPSRAPGARIGFVCDADMGHLIPSVSLAHVLRERGHEVIFYQLLDNQPWVEQYGFRCEVYGRKTFPPGAWRARQKRIGGLSGWRAMVFLEGAFQLRVRSALTDLPALFQRDQLDFVLVDQATPEAGAVAESQGLPYVTISSAMLFNQQPDVPPYFMPFRYRTTAWSRVLNLQINEIYNYANFRAVYFINRFRRRHDVRAERPGLLGVSPFAQICQQHASFDYPRKRLPKTLHYAGPFLSRSWQRKVEFPFDQLTGRPLVYASMGTLQNRTRQRFECIARACENIDVQLVISLGGGGNVEDFRNLAGHPLVVRYAPQMELLRRADVFVTHAGLNGTLESLSVGTPLIAMPVTNDQPGVASRIEWTGVGEKLLRPTPSKLKRLLSKVLGDGRYRERARAHAEEIAKSGGATLAADIIERILKTGSPVTRHSLRNPAGHGTAFSG